MRKYYELMMDSDLPEAMSVLDYEMGSFDLTELWSGNLLVNSIPNSVRLFVDDESSLKPDYLGNPISWPIFSKKFISLVDENIKNNCEIIEAPLYSHTTKKAVTGYYIVNVLPVIKCIDENKSILEKFDDGEIDCIYSLKIDSSLIPEDIDIFRVCESTTSILISEAFLEKIKGKGVSGVALMES